MKSFVRNHPFWFAIILILAAVMITGALSVATDGFRDFNPFERNEANLLTVGEDGNLLEKIDTDALPKGLDVTMDEKGVITIDGDSSDETTHSIVTLSQEITLEAGKTYTFTTGKKGVNKDTVSGKDVNVMLYGTNTSYIADVCGLGKDGTFTIAEDATDLTFVLKVTIYPGEYDNVRLYPVLVEGDTAAAFFD